MNLRSLIIATILTAMFSLAGCGAVINLAGNRFSDNRQPPSVKDVAGSNLPASNAETVSGLNGQTSPKCQSLMRGQPRNKIGSRSDLPADFPVPRGTVLCGENMVNGVTFVNETLADAQVAQFYREALPAVGFRIDNEYTSNSISLSFGRGTSESIGIEIVGNRNGADYEDSFSVDYVPPTDERGNPLPIAPMSRRSGNISASATPIAQTANAECGNNPLGSYKCAAELQSKLKSWQFSIEEKDERGRIKAFKGERALPGNNRVVIHVAIAGVSRKDDGEWWYRLGSVAGQNDNGYRLYYKETGGWQRIESPPDNMGDLVAMSNVVSPLWTFGQTAAGAETINGQQCNHFRRTDSETGEEMDTWVSQATGYALRVVFKNRSGYTKQSDFSRQNEALNIETPPGAQ